MTGTVVNLIQAVLNGRRRRSVEDNWKIQNRTKRVTLKIFNIKSVPDTSVTDAEQKSPGSPPLLSFAGDTEQELHLIDLVTEYDSLSANSNAVAHGRNWTTNEAVTSLNGAVTKKIYKVIGQSGDIFTSGSSPRDLSPFDCFISMFPMKQLEVIKSLPNLKLEEHDICPVTAGELLRFFVLPILLTKLNVSNRLDLWKKIIKIRSNSLF